MNLPPSGANSGPYRAETVAQRLNALFSSGANLEYITPGIENGQRVVHQVPLNASNPNLIVTATNEDASYAAQTRWHLTLQWANYIRGAIDKPPLCITNGQAGKLQLTDAGKQGIDPVVATWSQTKATWYGYETSYNQTASGECWHPYDITCAIWAMDEADTCIYNRNYVPFGTYIRVTNLNNNVQIVVRVTDRGPRKTDRACQEKKFIDLSRGAAEAIGFNFDSLDGSIPVRLEQLS